MSHVRRQRTSPAKLGPRPPLGPLVATRAHFAKTRPRARKPVLYCQHLEHTFSRSKTPTIAFSETCALLHRRRKFNASVSNHFRTLSALFCRSSQLNSCVFMRSRTLCEKHPGRGWGRKPTLLQRRSLAYAEVVGYRRSARPKWRANQYNCSVPGAMIYVQQVLGRRT